MAKMTSRWRRYLPYLDFYLDLGVIRIGTSVMYDQFERDTREYVRLRIEILHKEILRWRLYTTYERIEDRKEK